MANFDVAAFSRHVSNLNPSLFRSFKFKDISRYANKQNMKEINVATTV